MVAADKVFAGSIPEVYDRLLVPLIFEPYARDLAERVAGAKPQDVLEVAAGTGALTREIVARLPVHSRIVATDLNQPMLGYAAARQSHRDSVTWQQADALALPFKEREFDVVACQFGVMFFPDKIKGYGEARRVLKPGGVLVFQLADSLRSSALMKLRAKLALRSRMQSFLGGGKPYSMEMHCISEADIRKLVHASGARVVDVCLTNSADPSFCGNLQYVKRAPESGYVSKQYCVVKAA